MPIESHHLVDDVMRRWPATIRVFLDYRMRCVGCPIACFHTVDDACREHGADGVRFLADLRSAAARGLAAEPVLADEPG
jgi:hybrid cluster-associated redox disulfide protein